MENRPELSRQLGAIELLDTLTQYDKFQEWHDYQYDDGFDQIPVGYAFLTETILRKLPDTFDMVFDEVGIETNHAYYWAQGKGVKLDSVGNFCEAIRFYRGCSEFQSLLRRARDPEALKKALSQLSNDFLPPLRALDNHLKVTPSDFTADEIATNQAQRLLFRECCHLRHKTQEGNRIPRGYRVPFLKKFLHDERRLDDAFIGYKRGIEFLWHQLKGESEFRNSAISNITNAGDWDDIHDVGFSVIIDEIVEGSNDTRVILDGELPDNHFESILSDSSPVLSTEEELDHRLYWKEVYFLNADPAVWKGASGFVTLLYGLEDVLKNTREEEIHICEFRHPVTRESAQEHHRKITYGILVSNLRENSSHLREQTSGWVMFDKCCNNFSGYGSSQHRLAEDAIDSIDIEIVRREMTIEATEFQELMAPRSVNTHLDHELLRTDKERKFEKARGVLVELLTYYTAQRLSQDDEARVDWNVTEEGRDEVDVEVETTDEITLLECKYNPRNYDLVEECRKLRSKMDASAGTKEVRGEFWFWEEPSSEQIEEIEAANDIDYSMLSQRVDESSVWSEKNIGDIKNLLYNRDDDPVPPG